MANHITMGEREAIIKLYEQGWHKRRIARELGFDRKTVRKHIRQWEGSKSPIMLTGDGPPKGTISPAGKLASAGRPSRCEPYHAIISAGMDEGLSGPAYFPGFADRTRFYGGV